MAKTATKQAKRKPPQRRSKADQTELLTDQLRELRMPTIRESFQMTRSKLPLVKSWESFDFDRLPLQVKRQSCLMRTCRSVDSARSQYAVHNLQLVSPAVVDGETGLASSPDDQNTFELRRSDHRRLGLCATGSRRDGSSVHTTGGTLRTGERAVDEQPSVQQMGSDLQGCDDHSSSDRPLGTPQRDHRAERPQLPSGNSKEDKTKNMNRNSSCR